MISPPCFKSGDYGFTFVSDDPVNFQLETSMSIRPRFVPWDAKLQYILMKAQLSCGPITSMQPFGSCSWLILRNQPWRLHRAKPDGRDRGCAKQTLGLENWLWALFQVAWPWVWRHYWQLLLALKPWFWSSARWASGKYPRTSRQQWRCLERRSRDSTRSASSSSSIAVATW